MTHLIRVFLSYHLSMTQSFCPLNVQNMLVEKIVTQIEHHTNQKHDYRSSTDKGYSGSNDEVRLYLRETTCDSNNRLQSSKHSVVSQGFLGQTLNSFPIIIAIYNNCVKIKLNITPNRKFLKLFFNISYTNATNYNNFDTFYALHSCIIQPDLHVIGGGKC